MVQIKKFSLFKYNFFHFCQLPKAPSKWYSSWGEIFIENINKNWLQSITPSLGPLSSHSVVNSSRKNEIKRKKKCRDAQKWWNDFRNNRLILRFPATVIRGSLASSFGLLAGSYLILSKRAKFTNAKLNETFFFFQWTFFN